MYPSATSLQTGNNEMMMKSQQVILNTNGISGNSASIAEIKLIDSANCYNNTDLIQQQQLHHYQVIPQGGFSASSQQQQGPIEYVRVLQAGDQKFMENHHEILEGAEMEPSTSSSSGTRRLNHHLDDEEDIKRDDINVCFLKKF